MRNKFLILVGILFLLNLCLVSSLNPTTSHFVCGIVNDSSDNVSSSWYNVKVFYPFDEDNYASCDVSPEGNKYCCDIGEFAGDDWNIGEVVFARVSDSSTGYAAGPVSAILSGESYDIAETMKLEKVININSPSKKLILSNATSVLFNASFLIPYNFVELEREGVKETICENCTSYSGNLSFEFGMNYLNFFASNNQETFTEEISFALLNYAELNREIECDKCKDNKVKSSSLVNMSLNFNLSHDLENFILKEYVPSSWIIEDLGGGEIGEFNEDYNVIFWNVSGKEINLKYSVQAPSVKIRPQEFSFKSELENLIVDESNITVYRFFSFWRIIDFIPFDPNNWKSVKISPTHPFVFSSDNEILKGGIFVNNFIDKARFRIYESNMHSPIQNIESLHIFNVRTNIKEREVEKVLFQIKLEKNSTEDFDKLKFFIKPRGGWTEINPVEIEEDKDFFYFYFETELFRRLMIGQEKQSFLSNFFNSFSRFYGRLV